MQKLIQGIHQFQKDSFRPLQGLFEELAKGQNPETLFITCSDSRIDPTLLTKAQPGDIFILRNAGNIIPPHGAGNGGEAATMEFAVAALGVAGGSVESFGKAAAVGAEGELEHAAAVLHPKLGAPFGAASGTCPRDRYSAKRRADRPSAAHLRSA